MIERNGGSMEDMISRKAAIDLFPNDDLECDTKGGYIAPHLARQMICELPSAQPVAKDINVPNKDCISRQYAIRIVDGIDTWQAGWRGNAIESIKALPSAQPETPMQIGWICPVCGRGLSPLTSTCPCNDGKGWEITC